MRGFWIAALTLALGAGAAAQTPPQNAVDITNVPATTAAAGTAPALGASTAPSVIRIYVDTLSGADATALQGLLTQALFESKKVVVTENEANATLILKGRVLRQLPASAAKPPAHTTRRSRKRPPAPRTTARTSAMPGGMTDGMVVTDLDNLQPSQSNGAGLGSDSGADLGSGSPDLSLSMLDLNSPVDLSRYDYRLDLRLVSPDGDLVWMSGQGEQAPAFASASTAVGASVPSMLTAVASQRAIIAAAAAAAAAGSNPGGGGQN